MESQDFITITQDIQFKKITWNKGYRSQNCNKIEILHKDL